MAYTEKEIIEIIKKYIYCDEHRNGDAIGFLILETAEINDYIKIKEYFELTPTNNHEKWKLEGEEKKKNLTAEETFDNLWGK